jgi:hypothetical protein
MILTARQILQKTPKSRRSDFVKIEATKVLQRKNGNKLVKSKVYSTHTIAGVRKSPPYTRYIATVEIDKKAVKVSCSCDDFWSVWEYALTQKGAADIEYCNGDPPVEKNPQYVAGCCKHLYKILTKLIDKNIL